LLRHRLGHRCAPSRETGRYGPGACRRIQIRPLQVHQQPIRQHVPFDGTCYLIASGTEDKPIAIKAAGDGPAVFDGNGAFNLFNVKAADYTYFEGLTIRNNYVANFHDGIDIETHGNPDGSSAADGPKYPPKLYWDRRPVAIDFYNNYMTNFHDNPFETDGGMHNVRVRRNMMINSASHAFCNQPSNGGPVYWVRNIAYHLPGGSTRLTNGSAGVLFTTTRFSRRPPLPPLRTSIGETTCF
jgi:hypothetical protein